MSKTLDFDFNIDRANNKITIRREFAARLPLVWDAYSRTEILEKWWAPKPWKARTKSMDFKEGGHWHYAMVGPEGQEHWGIADYKEIKNQKKITGLDAFADQNGKVNSELPQSKWEILFTDKDEVTLVEYTITYGDLEQLEKTLNMGFKEGMTLALDGLDDVLADLKK